MESGGGGLASTTGAEAQNTELGRMIEAGEDPKFIARRMVVFASEDIGMAQPADHAVDPAPEPESGWALEQLAPHARFGYRATALQTLQTPYQKLELLQTPQFGKGP